ncbi:yellow-1 [Asbolus verrucosus]|uniref:Yellow-1 n=1 Tax=Asbolus verrucosus TaxID=1661398 RepID=A0A482W1M5_ASBVE|nr:yellow-1 [Asbolus verrucosus]
MQSPVCLLLFTIFCAAEAQSAKFQVIRQWKYVNFTWPDDESFKTAVAKGLYIPENNIIAGAKYFDDHFYVTLPRMRTGVPATLARIKAGPTQETSPKLQPFPSWQMNGIDDCNNLQSVQNVEIDTKGQIWIIDGGRIDTLMNSAAECSPKLLIFDIKSNRTNTVYVFPEDVAPKATSFLYDLVVDNTDGGYAYVTDNSAHDPGIIVFSVKENRAWKIRNAPSMAADPAAIHFTVNGIAISTPVNIAGIALGPKVHTSNDKLVINEAREVYFSPLSSLNLFSVNTTILRNENLTRQNFDYGSAIKNVGLKPSQSVGMVMDNQGILYYTLLANNAIGRWDSHTPFDTEQRLIARDNKYIEWPNSFAFDQNGNLTVVVNRLNRFIFDKLDLGVYNFRLISAEVGGKSYLYDDTFNYDSENGNKMVTTESTPPPSSSFRPSSSSEPVPSSSSEPVPSPEPEPSSGSNQQSSPTPSIDSNVTVSSACRFMVSLFSVTVSAILFLV